MSSLKLEDCIEVAVGVGLSEKELQRSLQAELRELRQAKAENERLKREASLYRDMCQVAKEQVERISELEEVLGTFVSLAGNMERLNHYNAWGKAKAALEVSR